MKKSLIKIASQLEYLRDKKKFEETVKIIFLSIDYLFIVPEIFICHTQISSKTCQNVSIDIFLQKRSKDVN